MVRFAGDKYVGLGLVALLGNGVYKGVSLANGNSNSLVNDPLMYVPVAVGGLVGGMFGLLLGAHDETGIVPFLGITAGAGVVAAAEGLGVCLGYTISKFSQ